MLKHQTTPIGGSQATAKVRKNFGSTGKSAPMKSDQGFAEEHEVQKSEYPASCNTKNFQRELPHGGIDKSPTVTNKN
jgi:hypothetical protein